MTGAQEIDPVLTSTIPAQNYRAGAASAANPKVRLQRILLLLQPSAAQQKQLESLLAAQVTPGNPGFHQWVTPVEFAQQFAVSAADSAKVAAWLRAQGFVVAAIPASRSWIEFSGTVAQVEHAFGVPVVAVASARRAPNGVRYQISGNAKLPDTLASLVKGLVSLDGSLSTPASTAPVELGVSVTSLATGTSLSGAQALTPSLFAGWLHLYPLHASGVNGDGETIAILSRSNVRVQDFAAFRASFGLPEASLNVKISGDDPGRTDDEAAAIQAASWAGAAAPNARILVVPAATTNATDGIDLALAAVMEGHLAHTVSLGYTSCESGMSEAHLAFYALLYRQAAAEGVAIVAATGDSGAAACHQPDDAAPIATGWSVNGLASTPWNTAVGAVAFSSDASSLTGWQPSMSADAALATGGGASSLYNTPAWQSGTGVPADDPVSGAAPGNAHPRYLPDLSLPTAAGDAASNSSLAFCFAGAVESNGCRVVTGGGSSASAAIFAGIAALLAQKYGPQGNLAPNLYGLSRMGMDSSSGKSSQAVLDITSGGAKLRCVPDSADCITSPDGTSEIGFAAAPGYDLASGLGSINAQALVQNWAAPQIIGTSPVTVEMTNTPGITYNPSAIIALTAKVISGSGGAVPTGTVQFYDKTVTADAGLPVALDATGTATYSESGQFTQGGHDIEAIYSGDSTYQAATSQPVVITIEPSPTSLTVAPSTTTPGAGVTFTVTGTVTSTNAGASPPTGILTVNLDGLPQGTAPLSTTGTVTSASVSVVAPTAGGHAVQGIYSGDINYNNSTSPSVIITISTIASVTSISAVPATLTPGVPETFTATVAPLSATIGVAYTLTGTVSFYDGLTLLGTAAISGNTAILPSATLAASVAHTITAVYSGDSTYSPSTSAPLILQPILLPVNVVLISSSGVLAPGQSANLTATVTPVNTPIITAEQHPTGTVYFYAGTTLLGSALLATGVGDSSTAMITVPILPAGTYVLTAVYAGDLTYGPASSNSLGLQVEDFTITCTPNSTTVVQGQAVSVACVVASLGGLTGQIQVVCAEQNPPQVGPLGCTFSPDILEGNEQTTMTVTTTAGTILQSSFSGRPPHLQDRRWIWPGASGGTALALAVFVLCPFGSIRRRARFLSRSASRSLLGLALLLMGLAGAGLGCTSGVSVSTNTGTPLGVHTIKITAAANLNPPTVTVSHYAYVTVNVTPIGGK